MKAMASASASARTPVKRLGHLRRWVAGQLGGLAHEQRVAAIASSLARHTASLHSLDKAQRRMLQMAAIVHDVGRCVNDRDHPAIGARMLLRDASLPLRNRQRRALAYLTLHHRGRVPDLHKDQILNANDDAQGLRLVLAFLRAADGLDSRSLPSPKLNFKMTGRYLEITCRLRTDSPKARRTFTRAKKFRLLEELLGCRVRVNLKSGHTSRKFRLAA